MTPGLAYYAGGLAGPPNSGWTTDDVATGKIHVPGGASIASARDWIVSLAENVPIVNQLPAAWLGIGALGLLAWGAYKGLRLAKVL